MDVPTPPSASNYPVNVTAPYPERSSRTLALLTLLFLFPKMLLLIPHLIALWLLGVIAFFAFVLGQFAVLFTGSYPRALFDLVLGTARWRTRVTAYIFGLTDSYPPFRLD